MSKEFDHVREAVIWAREGYEGPLVAELTDGGFTLNISHSDEAGKPVGEPVAVVHQKPKP